MNLALILIELNNLVELKEEIYYFSAASTFHNFK